jgi:hypothetical protein
MISTLESFALGDSNAVNHFVLGKDLLDRDLLLEMLAREINLKQERNV